MSAVRPLATLTLIAANIVVFVTLVAFGISATNPDAQSLLAVGANSGVAVVMEREWWRSLTAMFIHVGAVHLVVNMYSLWQVGAFVETMLGRRLYLLVYVLTGLAGSFASIMWNPLSISAGASGAIFGLFGTVVGFTLRARHELPKGALTSLRSSIVTTLAFNLLFALLNPMIDTAAHVGGLAAGTLAGFMATASSLDGPVRRRPTLGSQAIVVAFVVGVAILAQTRTSHHPRVRWAQAMAVVERLAAEENDPAAVKQKATEALLLRDEPSARLLRGWASVRLGDLDAGLADFDRSIEMAEKDESSQRVLPHALLLRGQARAAVDDLERAEVDLTRLIALADDPTAHELRGTVRMRRGLYDAAVEDLAAASGNAVAKNNYAWALVQLGRDLDLALALADEAVALDATAAALGTRCWVHQARNELELARADCQAALSKGAGEVDRGMLAYLDDRRDEAVTIWQTAAQDNPQVAREVARLLELAKRK